eukprot:SAG31_NODE_26434_length_442_cov_1.093294_1_plen_81_part_10
MDEDEIGSEHERSEFLKRSAAERKQLDAAAAKEIKRKEREEKRAASRKAKEAAGAARARLEIGHIFFKLGCSQGRAILRLL